MPTEDLRLALIQVPLYWEDAEANRDFLDQWLNSIAPVDLVLLPEMFTTGFSMNAAALAEPLEGPTLAWMKDWAQQLGAVLAGSVIIEEEGHYYNRLIWMPPDGSYSYYDKKHLFSLAGEEKIYSPGKSSLIVEYKTWRINPLICFDLRFPVWCRNTRDFDLQLFVANWPKKRRHAWKTLLPARAVENVSYVAGLNRVGPDGNDVAHAGDSAIYDPLGKLLEGATPEKEMVFTTTLSAQELQKTREKFAFLEEQDSFSLDF